MPTQLVIWGLAGVSLVLAAVLIYVWSRIRRMSTFVSPFEHKPSTAGQSTQTVIPEHFPGFHRLDRIPHFDTQDTYEVKYKGLGAKVNLRAVRAGSIPAAAGVMRQFRRGGRRAGFVANIEGDRSYVVRHLAEEATIAWTNGPWAFIATGKDYIAVQEFVNNYPY